MSDEKLVPIFMPALIYLIAHMEKNKGTPLTEQEVLEIRDRGVVMMMQERDAQALAEKRGYDDLDPEYCWQQWLEIRDDVMSGFDLE